jgi:hypothetical protein
MNVILAEAISGEASKLVRRHQRYASDLASEIRRKERRSCGNYVKEVKLPEYWKADDGFNPYHVRANAKAITYAIDRALSSQTYKPRSAVVYQVPKSDGGVRDVSVFQVADNAISRLTFDRLIEKNSRHFSAHAYAYRRDLSVHDAVLHIASDFRSKSRVFVAEFDFKKYFDSIAHEHILRILGDRRFFITRREQQVIEAFLRTPTFAIGEYKPNTDEIRARGIPQGTSISLFLANVAAYPLDRHLERIGVGFARYADDTLIWSENYSDLCRAVNILEEVAADMDVELNFKKSEGISILCVEDFPAEFKSKKSVAFLGYKIRPDQISIRDANLVKIKQRLSYLVYSNLLQPLKHGCVRADRVSGGIDLDYIVMLYQIRRYLYGELSESQLRKYLARQTPMLTYHGIMSFYPVVDDDALLKDLDGWLLNSVYRALRLRARLFGSGKVASLPSPHGLTKAQILQLRHKQGGGHLRDLRFPSVARMARLLRRAARTYGASSVANPKSNKYHLS